MSKEEITKEILSILGNFNLSENIQIKELVSLYMKQQQEIERLENINSQLVKECQNFEDTIDKAIEYIEENIGSSNNHLYFELLDEEIEDFLKILKGEDKSETN